MNIDPKNIKNLILDFGGVIYQIDHQKQIEAFTALGIKDFGDLYSQAMQSELFTGFECGNLAPDTLISEILEILGRDKVNRERVVEAWNSILVGYLDDAVNLLEKLKFRMNLYLLSNTNEIHYELFTDEFREQRGYDFNSLFVKPYWSFKMGKRKPDIETYQFVLNDSGLNPDETLFIDDSPQNIRASVLAGLPAYHLSHPKMLTDLFNNDLRLNL